MFYATKQNKYIVEGTAFELDGVQYPANWLNCSSAEEKAAIGLVEVQVVGAPADDRYYWVSTTLEDGVMTYVNTPKDLVDVKTIATGQVNNTAYGLLLPSDWMVVKAMETSTKVAPAWNSWRQAVRDVASSAVAGIEGAQDVDAVAATMENVVWPKDPNQVLAEQGVAA